MVSHIYCATIKEAIILILEGCRKSGKSHTLQVIRNNFDVIVYKDDGMNIIFDTQVDPDDYSIGRDLAYAQFIPKYVDPEDLSKTIFDRQYWSSYVYGQAWRNNYDKDFWDKHIESVEKAWAAIIKHINIVLITPKAEDFDRMESLDRESDNWDNKKDYRRQHELYEEVWKVSTANKFRMSPFQSEKYIVDTFKSILKPER